MAKIDANGANLLLGRGKWYFDRKDSSGAYGGYRFLGNADASELTAEAQKAEKYGSTTSATIKLKSVVTQQNFTLTMNLSEYTAENLAMAFFGTTGTLTQTGATVTGEALTGGANAQKGRIYKTAYRNISAVTVKQASTSLVLDTDYSIQDDKTGLIYIMPTSSTVTGLAPLTADYTYGTVELEKASAGTVGSVEGRLLFAGDPAAGPAFDVEFWNVTFSPNGAIALITDDFGGIPLTGEVLADFVNHPTEPLYRLVKRS